jgi:hypothetical protein
MTFGLDLLQEVYLRSDETHSLHEDDLGEIHKAVDKLREAVMQARIVRLTGHLWIIE